MNNTFNVIDSILSPNQLASFIQERYGFSNNVLCKVFRTGINHTYLVSDGSKKYMLRVYSYNWREKSEIEEELKFILKLKANNLSVSFPIVDKTDHYIQEIEAPEGIRYAVLFSFAEGEKIRGLTEEQSEEIGQLMGQIHKYSENEKLKRISYNESTLAHNPYQYAKNYFDESVEEMVWVKNAIQQIESVFQLTTNQSLRQGAVHLDIWYDNMNIEGPSNITLFDFDFCGNGWLVLDIAYFAKQLFNTEPDKLKYENKLASFYRGYESVIPISKNEKQLIPIAGLAVWIFYLGVQSQRFDNWSNIFLTKNYLKHYIGLVKSWLAYYNVKI